ncbi:hypothetical protein B566_EDAN000119 [Ephemera danica]|nr:hypothetical protein B566_EDAN000119 [Ephemera danica]
MTACSAALRQLGTGASSIEVAADRITRYLYSNLTTGPDEDPACVLVRLFKTHPYDRLSPELQALADARLEGAQAPPGMKCLTLLASTGSVAGWNHPAQSSRFRTIPLNGPDALAKLPMFSQLFTQFHLDLPFLTQAGSSLLIDLYATTFNAFYVPQALGSPYVPGQAEFVVPFGIQSVFGFGGMLSTGELFAVILFAKVPVTKDTADLCKAFALSAKLALAPFEHNRLILPQAVTASPGDQALATNQLASLQDRVATLEAILAVQEHAVEVQSDRLATTLANEVRHGQELQQQSVRFETLSTTSPVGIFETDADGRCLYTNDAWRTISGLSLTESLGDGWRRAICEEDRLTVSTAWSQTSKTGREFSLEFRMQRPDGTIRWVHVRSRPLKSETGQVTGHVGTTEDITEQRFAAHAVAESEQRYRTLIETSRDAIMTLAPPTWCFTSGNPATVQMFRVTDEAAFLALGPWELSPEWQPDGQRSADKARLVIERAMTDGCHRFEWTHRRYTGEEFPALIHLVRVQLNDTLQLLASVRDITEQKNVEETLRQSEQRYRRYFELGPIGMAITSLGKSWVHVNDRLCQIFGYSPDELITKTWAELTHPGDVALNLAQFNRVLAGEVDSYAIDSRVTHRDGRVIYASISTSAVRREDGSIDHFVTFVQDLTAQYEVEERLKESTRRLQRQIDEMPIGQIVWNRTFRIETWNPAAERIFGYTSHEAIGRHASFLVPEEFRFSIEDGWQQVLDGDTTIHTVTGNLAKDGRRITCQWASTPQRNAEGQVVGAISMVQDVTEQQGNQLQLRQLEERWADACTGNGDGVWDWDRHTDRVFFSNQWKEMLGYAEDEVGSTIEDWSSRVHPDDLPSTLADRQRHFRGDTPVYVNEHRMRCKDGSYKWILDRGKAVARTADGHPLRVVGTTTDITSRKALEKAHDEGYRLQQSILANAVYAIIATDPSGIITAFNPAAERMLGYTADEMIGLLTPAVFHDPAEVVARAKQFGSELGMPLAPGFDVFVEKSRRGLPNQHEWTYIRKDGVRVPALLGISTLHDSTGAITGYLGLALDLTDQKKSEALRFRLQQAVNHAQDGMALLDDAREFTYMNPAYASIFGYAVDELLGQHWAQLYPEEWASMIEQIHLPILRSEGQWQGELVGKQKSGKVFHLDLSLTLLEDPGTGRRTILCTCRDITHRKQMERDLINAKDAAEVGIRAKSEFLATMSHEIRTPMNGVLGMTDLLLDTALTTEQRDFTQTLKHSGESLMRIINDILDYSKIEAGKLTIESIPFDLRMTIEDILDLLAPTAQSKHLELVGLIDAQVPNAMIGDPGRIRQILTNLIGNAIKFTERGEVLVQAAKIEEDDASILLRFEIVDTGVGLTEEAQAKLFRSFTQADSSTARKYGGTGLGLAICKRLTELMGGQIGLQSSLGTGTCVWFTLQLRKQAPAVTSAHPPALIENLSGLRICLADDNATNRSLLQYHACDWKMHYENAEDGPSALALIRRAAAEGKPFDLAILDMQMPGMNGLQLGQAIRADPRLAHTRLVLLTSLGRRGDAKMAHSAGFSGYLTKPVRKAHLYNCLRLVMGQPPVPQADDQTAPALITRHQVAEVRAQRWLLVVDDNLVNQKVAVKMLEKLGHRVDVAANGKEALQALTRHPYNLVFMDCQMPELDGFETTRMIRTHEQPGCHLPIIAMTANTMEGDRSQTHPDSMAEPRRKPGSRIGAMTLHPPASVVSIGSEVPGAGPLAAWLHRHVAEPLIVTSTATVPEALAYLQSHRADLILVDDATARTDLHTIHTAAPTAAIIGLVVKMDDSVQLQMLRHGVHEVLGLRPSTDTDHARTIARALARVNGRAGLLTSGTPRPDIATAPSRLIHDLNNHLTSINGFADLLLAQLPADNPARKSAEHIRLAGRRAATLLTAQSPRQTDMPSPSSPAPSSLTAQSASPDPFLPGP